jgi:hypothetical protein
MRHRRSDRGDGRCRRDIKAYHGPAMILGSACPARAVAKILSRRGAIVGVGAAFDRRVGYPDAKLISVSAPPRRARSSPQSHHSEYARAAQVSTQRRIPVPSAEERYPMSPRIGTRQAVRPDHGIASPIAFQGTGSTSSRGSRQLGLRDPLNAADQSSKAPSVTFGARLAATLPHLATKADLARIETGLPHLGTKASLPTGRAGVGVLGRQWLQPIPPRSPPAP